MKCPEPLVDRAHVGKTRPCNRPVAPGEIMCTVHLAAERRRETNEAKRRELRAADQNREKAAQTICDELKKKGIDAEPHWSLSQRGFSGNIVVMKPELLLELLR